MRQAGIVAAAGLYALDHHVERLTEDHLNAGALADRLAAIPGVRLDPSEVETNLVFIDVAETGWTAPALSRRLREDGVLIGAETATRLRAVTHLDVDRAGALRAADAVRRIVAEVAPAANDHVKVGPYGGVAGIIRGQDMPG